MSIDTAHDESVLETIGEPVTAPEHLVEVRRRPGPRRRPRGRRLAGRGGLPRPRGRRRRRPRLGAGRRARPDRDGQPRRAARRPHAAARRRRPRRPAAAGPHLGRACRGVACTRSSTAPRRGWWRDGLLDRPHPLRPAGAGGPRSRRPADRPAQPTAARAAPLAVPLGLGTRVVGAEPDLTTALRELADRTAATGRRDRSRPGGGPTPASSPRPRPAARRSRTLIGAVAAASSARPRRSRRGPRRGRRGRAGARRQRDPRAGPRDRRRRPGPRCATRRAPSSSWTTLEEDTQVWGELHAVPEADGTAAHRRLRRPARRRTR